MEIIQDDYTTINHLICLSDSDETIDNLVDLFFKHYFIDERDELENDVVSYLEDEIDDMICKSKKELYITTKDLITCMKHLNFKNRMNASCYSIT